MPLNNPAIRIKMPETNRTAEKHRKTESMRQIPKISPNVSRDDNRDPKDFGEPISRKPKKVSIIIQNDASSV